MFKFCRSEVSYVTMPWVREVSFKTPGTLSTGLRSDTKLSRSGIICWIYTFIGFAENAAVSIICLRWCFVSVAQYMPIM